MIRILRKKTHQIKKSKSGTKDTETRDVEISGFNVKGTVEIVLIGDIVRFKMEQ